MRPFLYLRFIDAIHYFLKRYYHKKDPYTFRIRLKNRERISAIIVPYLKFRKKRVKEDFYLWNIRGEEWLATHDQLHGLYEYLEGQFEKEYPTDFEGKVVLDIGGYIGDSARYFLKKGAAKVILYEPAKKNITSIESNLKAFKDRIIVEPKGLSENDGLFTIISPVPEGHIGFGFGGEGLFESHVEGESIATIVSKHKADIVKVDCEGQEKVLLTADNASLQKVPYWMVETHSKELLSKMHQKFKGADFQVIRVYANPKNSDCTISHFSL